MCPPGIDGSGFLVLAHDIISVQAGPLTSRSRSELNGSDASLDEIMAESLRLCRTITSKMIVKLRDKLSVIVED
jgi:hypothetical protein